LRARDIDGIAERNGKFLVMEWKRPNEGTGFKADADYCKHLLKRITLGGTPKPQNPSN